MKTKLQMEYLTNEAKLQLIHDNQSVFEHSLDAKNFSLLDATTTINFENKPTGIGGQYALRTGEKRTTFVHDNFHQFVYKITETKYKDIYCKYPGSIEVKVKFLG